MLRAFTSGRIAGLAPDIAALAHRLIDAFPQGDAFDLLPAYAQAIPVITIGMGPDADIDTLRRISETTGGKAYTALDPNDIETVFLDAMIERRCRPDC